MHTHQLISQSGKSVEGLMMVNTFDTDSKNPAFLKFSDKYEKLYNLKVNFASKRAYEAAIVLFESLKINTDPEKLKSTIIKTHSYRGLQGDIKINRFGDVERKMFNVHY